MKLGVKYVCDIKVYARRLEVEGELGAYADDY